MSNICEIVYVVSQLSRKDTGNKSALLSCRFPQTLDCSLKVLSWSNPTYANMLCV